MELKWIVERIKIAKIEVSARAFHIRAASQYLIVEESLNCYMMPEIWEIGNTCNIFEPDHIAQTHSKYSCLMKNFVGEMPGRDA